MDNIKYYDTDGYELEFEDDTPPEERIYYSQQYPNVKFVANKRTHCTSCNIHIGTPISAEDNVKMHAVLRVTQCAKCYRFCNSGAYDKDEDGSELYCRWCGEGEGDELYCCTGCPYVFCQKCILRNFNHDGLQEVLSNDNWKCYACVPQMLYPLRAQHWALVNFIKKQEKALNSKMNKGLRDQDAIAYHMKKDSSICCPSKTTAPRRRRPDTSDEEDDSYSESNVVSEEEENTSEMSDTDLYTRKKKKVQTNGKTKTANQKEIKPKTYGDTPNVVSEEEENTSEMSDTDLYTRKKKKVQSNGKPKTANQKEIKPKAYGDTPVLSDTRNKAELSQKRKLSPTSTVTSSSNTVVNDEPDKTNYLDLTLEANDSENDTVTTTTIPKKQKTSSTSKNDVRTDENRASSSKSRVDLPNSIANAIHRPIQRHIYSKTDVGRARTHLESKMFNAMEMCQQVDGKVKTLMNSNRYITAHTMTHVKEQYTHLLHILACTNGRVQSLQKKCMDDLRKFGSKNDALACGNDQSSSDSDEDEIDEPSHTIITLDDSDDEEAPEKMISNNENTTAAATANLDPLNGDENHLNNDCELPIATPPSASLQNVCNIDISSDRKLQLGVKIVVKRAEKDIPDLMKEPLLRIMNRLIEENNRRNQSESNQNMNENETDGDERTEKTNMEMETSNENNDSNISIDVK